MNDRKIINKILEEFGLPAENIQQCTTDILIGIGLGRYLEGFTDGLQTARVELSNTLYEEYYDKD